MIGQIGTVDNVSLLMWLATVRFDGRITFVFNAAALKRLAPFSIGQRVFTKNDHYTNKSLSLAGKPQIRFAAIDAALRKSPFA